MIASSEQHAAMLDAASASGYALAAVNVTSLETLNGAMRGFAEAGADGIVQITTGRRRVSLGRRRRRRGAWCAGARGVRPRAGWVLPGADRLAHRSCAAGEVRQVRAPADRRVALAGGRRRGAAVSVAHVRRLDVAARGDLRFSARLLDELAPLGVVLEVESGVVGGEEDGIAGARANRDEVYTTTADPAPRRGHARDRRARPLPARGVVRHVHGLYAPGSVKLRPELLRDGQDAVAAAHPGARLRYVFHGSSGSAPDEVRAAIANGVVKVNLDTDAQYAFTRAIADHVFANYDGVLRVDGAVGHKAAYDPWSWGRKAEAALADRVADAAQLFGSSSRSVLR